MEKIILRNSEDGIRLDKFIARETGISRSKVKKDILNGLALVDGEIDIPDRRLKGGEFIEYTPSPPEEVKIVPEPIPIKVIYEDDYIVVIDKPAGMVVHPAAGNRTGTLVNALLYWFDDWDINGYVRPGIVHRLDKDTSGVMVVARNEESQRKLVEQFKARKVEKKYIAMVIGHPSPEGVVDVPIGRDRFNRLKYSTNSTAPKDAVTEWKVLEYFAETALLEVHPHTGRTHQIRVHFSHLGFPLVGDKIYGGVRRTKKVRNEDLSAVLQGFQRHALHASFISFSHPATGEKVAFSAPLPSDMEKLIMSLRSFKIDSN